MDPLLLAFAAFVVVIAGVLWLRLPAFLALIFATLLVALGTPSEQLRNAHIKSTSVRVGEVQDNSFAADQLKGPHRVFRSNGLRLEEVGEGTVSPASDTTVTVDGIDLRQGDYLLHERDLGAVASAARESAGNRVAFGFGDTCRKIGLLIAMASVIGCCLLESGAALRIVEVTRQVFGEKRTPLAFAVSGFVVGIPVFFDTVFYLLMPLAKAMRVKTGRNYLLYVMSIVVGGSMAHSLVPPTPGPLLVASKIDGVEVVDMMIGGLFVGFFSVASGFLYSLWANRRWEIPLRNLAKRTESETDAAVLASAPSFWLSVLPIALPVMLLALGTTTKGLNAADGSWLGMLLNWTQFLGEKNIALTLSAVVALAMLIATKQIASDANWPKAVQSSLTSGGMILLITAAGGAFGHVLRQSGVAESIQHRFPGSQNGMLLLCLAFVVTMLVRFVQGSATVAMITSVSIVAPLAKDIVLGFHPVYLALAIGCGSKPLPWMNDSGFWIVGKMSGMTEGETLKTFSVTLTIMGVVGFLVTLAGAHFLPFAP